jgi:hypothetical protein
MSKEHKPQKASATPATNILHTQGSLNNKKLKPGNQVYEELRYKMHPNQAANKNNFSDNQRRIGLSVNSNVHPKLNETAQALPASSRQQDTQGLQAFKDRQPGAMVGAHFANPSGAFGSSEATGANSAICNSNQVSSVLPQLVAKPGNALNQQINLNPNP